MKNDFDILFDLKYFFRITIVLRISYYFRSSDTTTDIYLLSTALHCIPQSTSLSLPVETQLPEFGTCEPKPTCTL